MSYIVMVPVPVEILKSTWTVIIDSPLNSIVVNQVSPPPLVMIDPVNAQKNFFLSVKILLNGKEDILLFCRKK